MTDTPKPHNSIAGRTFCGANAKQTGKPCRGAAMENGRCRMHGGKARRGITHPSTTHGRYSKYLFGGLAENYRTLLEDPTLTQLRPEIALIATLLEKKLEGLAVGASLDAWTGAKAKLTEYRRSPNDSLLDELDAMLTEGRAQFDLFVEIQPIVEQHRKLVETENRRVHQLSKHLTTEEAIAFVRALADCVKRHVTVCKNCGHDLTDITAEIQRDVSTILGG